MNIVLLGYRGCGKSTVGRLLAQRLEMDFVDVDEEVCRRFNRPHIAAVWQEYGEDVFRQMEAITVVELLGQDGHVIALGGGSVMHEEARAALGQAGNVVRVYLRCEAGELLRRVRADAERDGTRPNPRALGGGVEQIKRMLAVREPWYAALADHCVDVTTLSQAQAVQTVMEALRDGSRR